MARKNDSIMALLPGEWMAPGTGTGGADPALRRTPCTTSQRLGAVREPMWQDCEHRSADGERQRSRGRSPDHRAIHQRRRIWTCIRPPEPTRSFCMALPEPP
jgi:hypothetical protein